MAINLSSLLKTIANATGLGKPTWAGGGGTASIKDMINDSVQATLERGVMSATSTTALSFINGGDTTYVMVDGVGLYKFNPTKSPAMPVGSYGALSGGRWDLQIANNKPYSEVIGDNTTLVFTISHKLGTLFPTVIETATQSGSSPYNIVQVATTITVVDEDNITVTYSAAPTTRQYTITVKP